jgi:hypothetical protein
VTPDLFLEAGATITRRAMAQGVAGDQVEAMAALAVLRRPLREVTRGALLEGAARSATNRTS